MRGIARTGSLLATLCLALLPSGNSVAAVFQCPAEDVTCLITSIHMANANSDSDTIQLASGTYSLTGVDNATDGPNGLPSISTPITIVGAGAESTRSNALPMRLHSVSCMSPQPVRSLSMASSFETAFCPRVEAVQSKAAAFAIQAVRSTSRMSQSPTTLTALQRSAY